MVVRCRDIIDVVRRVAPIQINQSKQTNNMCCLAHGELAWFFLEPDIGLDHCPRILLSCFRARTSGDMQARVVVMALCAHASHCFGFQHQLMYRVVHLDFTPESEVFYVLFERCHIIIRKGSIKQHS